MKEITARLIMKQLLQALAYLHTEKRIIHRDVKPSNIMVEWKNSPRQVSSGSTDHFHNPNYSY
jgi:serine/threonine protein kinase